MIEDCTIPSPRGPWVQGIDISFSMDKGMSMVEGCTIVGVREGIVTHMAMVDVTHNHVGATTLRGIDDGRDVDGHDRAQRRLGAHGVGILCLDHSECEIEHNTVVGTRATRRATRRARGRDRGALLREAKVATTRSSRAPAASRRSTSRRSRDERADTIPARRPHRAPELSRPAVGRAARGVGVARASST